MVIQYVVRDMKSGMFVDQGRGLTPDFAKARVFSKTGTARLFGKPVSRYINGQHLPCEYKLISVIVQLTDQVVDL